ncbi:MAG TPA: SRPBCC family protein [Burkholderiales bacterium]|nr:SRPBCC family protein [Burkholderiales bacterium]
MSVVEKTVEVQCPLSRVYNQWTQFESFPRFMEGVEDVKQTDDTHLHWRADIAGVDREWDAEITEQIPDRKIAWRSISGPGNGGTVTFQQIDPQRTRVTLRMEYDPKGFVENTANMLGVIDRRIEGDMKRFRDFIEERGQETGAWRGDVSGGAVRNKPH